jgi:hypothetical protein
MASRKPIANHYEPVARDDHWLGILLGLVGGLIIDALFGFKTDGFFTFVGIVAGNSGALDIHWKNRK